MISNRETVIWNKRNKNEQTGENQGTRKVRDCRKQIQNTWNTHATQQVKRTPGGHERQAQKDSENEATQKHKHSQPTQEQRRRKASNSYRNIVNHRNKETTKDTQNTEMKQ